MWILFYYSVLMFTCPFAMFFLAKYMCERILHYSLFTTNLISVISAVIIVNVIIFFYVCHNIKQQVILKPREKTD